MSLRETQDRVMKALNFQEPDRVPIYDIVQNIAFIEHYADDKITVENGEKVLCKALGNSIDLTAEINPPSKLGTFENNGFVYKVEWWTTWLMKRPFNDLDGLKGFIKKNIKEIENSDISTMWTYLGNLSFTGISEPNETVFKRQQKMCGDCMLVICESFLGLDTAYNLAGLELFSYLLHDDPALVSKWIQAFTRHEIERIHNDANPNLSPITLVCCDLAYKGGSLFSPDFLKINLFPQLKMICDAWHKHNTKVIFHSDGNLFEILDDLLEAGIDGLNPLEPIEGFDVPVELRRRYPNLALVGGVDAHGLLVNGTPEQVSDEIKRLIDQIAPGGGFFVGSSIEMHPACRPENLIAMVETTRNYGKY
jgi:uroporphyrinogen decarboxylase